MKHLLTSTQPNRKTKSEATNLANFHLFRTALIAASICLSITAAWAQSPKFGRNPTEPFSGKVKIIDLRKSSSALPPYARTATIDLDIVVREAWRTLRPQVTDVLSKFLNEKNIGEGFRTSRNNLTLGENGSLYFATDGTGITLKYTVPGNRLETSLRVPGPSPEGTDPRFAVNCVADVSVAIDRYGRTDIRVSPARVKMNCGKAAGVNLTGKAARGAFDLINFLGGPDFLLQWIAPLNHGTFAFNDPIEAELSKQLKGKTAGDTIIGISNDSNTTDTSGRKVKQVVMTIEDYGKPPSVH